MQLPLTIRLRRSRRLGVMLLIINAAALAATLLAALPLWSRLLLVVAIAASAWFTARRLRGPGRVSKLTLRADGMIDLERSSGSVGEAVVLAQSTVTSMSTVLLLRCAGRREALAVLPDTLDSDEFRALRLWLRWRAKLS